MSEGDPADLRERVVRARTRLEGIPAIGAGEPGPPDPETGERWTRLHVLGHTAEMLPFWCAQVRGVLAGGEWIGRGEGGYEMRQAAIDAGAAGDEADLRARVSAGVDDLLSLLDEAGGSDVSREVEYRGLTETETESIGSLIERRLVRHLESHVEQLEELTPGERDDGA